MPYYEMDPEYLEELQHAHAPEGVFYDPAEGVYDFEAGGQFTQAVRDALVQQGFTAVECRYDGGYDEGFAYFEHALFDLASDELPAMVQAAKDLGVMPESQRVEGAQLAELLRDSPLARAALDSMEEQKMPEAWKTQQRERLASISPEQQVLTALEDFADELASELLGRGYGTGEYTLRGRFRADLLTGQMTDLEDGQRGE